MGLSNVLKAGDWKKVLLAAYEEYIGPALKDFVASTENSWDDAAFTTVDGLLRGFLGDEKVAE